MIIRLISRENPIQGKPNPLKKNVVKGLGVKFRLRLFNIINFDESDGLTLAKR